MIFQVHVHDFLPYFYCDIPNSAFKSSTTNEFRKFLNDRVLNMCRSFNKPKVAVAAIALMHKHSLLGFSSGKQKTVLKITMTLPNLVPTARSLLTKGFTFQGYATPGLTTYESNVPYVLRFMVDHDIVGCNWLEIPKNRCSKRQEASQVSRCQEEYDVSCSDITSHSPALVDWMKIGPFRTLSFDIECMGRRGYFPDPKIDPVIQIANYVTVQGQHEPIIKNVFVLGSCLPIFGSSVHTFDNERALLLAWADFVRKCDPDIITGYNIQNFDMPYLLNRATALNCQNEFEYLGRIKNSKARMKKTTFSSSAFGKRESVETIIEGRIMLDVIQYMYRNHKLSSYSLNAVSATFLSQQKEDVHHSIISDLQRGTAEDRHRLAVYCLKDAYLPQKLIEKLLITVNYVEMARVTGVPISYLFSRGQQIKVLSMLYRKARKSGIIVPVVPKSSNAG